MSCTLPDLYRARAQIAAVQSVVGFFDSSQIGSAAKLIPIDQLPISHLDLNEEEKMSACKSRCPANAEKGTFFVKLLRPLKDLSLSPQSKIRFAVNVFVEEAL